MILTELLRRRQASGGVTLFFILCTLLLLCPGPSAAQGASLAFERLAQEHGLSNGTVTAIAQDSVGFLWFGTEDGLDRYDGKGFTSFRNTRGDSPAIGGSWVTGLAVAPDGTLWVSTLRGGISHFDPDSGAFTIYRSRPGDHSSLSTDHATSILATADGLIWIGTPDGLEMLDPATGTFTHHVPPLALAGTTGRSIQAISEDSTGLLWLGTMDRVLLFDRRDGSFRAADIAMYPSAVREIVRDGRGTMWIGSEHELLAVDPAVLRVSRRFATATQDVPSPFGGRVQTLLADRDGAVWVGSDDGLARIDPVTGRYTRQRAGRGSPRSPGGDIVRSVFRDRGGVLWVGLESYGVNKHAPSAVRFDILRDDPTAPISLSNGYTRGISEDRRGNLWIGTQFGGLNYLDRGRGRLSVYRHEADSPRSLPSDNIWGALEDHRGVLWVATHRGGFGTFDPDGGIFTRSPLLDSISSVTTLYEDRAGRLLVGTEGAGMLEISADRNRVTSFGREVGDRRVLAGDDIQVIFEDSSGMLWVGSTGGLTRLDRRTGRATQFHAAPGQPGRLQHEFITDVVEDHEGAIWVSTKGGGLARLDRGTDSFTTLGTAEGLPHDFVYGILEDAHGRLWVSTDLGLASVNPVTNRVIAYGLDDGLQAREFNRRAFLRARDGTMYFGGVNGINVFRPDDVPPPPSLPPVTVVSLTAGSREAIFLPGRGADSVVKVSHDQSSMTLTFRSLDYTAPSRTGYRYMLEGLSRGWTDGGDHGEAIYSNIPPGRYRFRVLAAGQDGVWGPEGEALVIVVTPPWWGRWWARLLILAVVGALVALFVRLRLRAVRRRSDWLEACVESQTRELTDAQLQLREALERERATAEELLEITGAVPGAVFQMRQKQDEDIHFTFVSEGVLRLWEDASEIRVRQSAHESVNRRELALRLVRLATGEDALHMQQSLDRSRESLLPWRYEWKWLSPCGRTGWLQAQAVPSLADDGAMEWTGVITDATAARKAEAARAALEAKVWQAQQAESLAVLAGGIAHDFNNLLVGVLGNAELLEIDLPPDGELAETVQHIRSAACRAAELTRQLLAYAGRGRFVVEQVDLPNLVQEMLALVRSAVPRTTSFDFVVDDGERPHVDADATQLRQVVMNLVTNASEAIGDGSGHVTVRVGVERRPLARLDLLRHSDAMPEHGPYAVLEVTDDGIGLDEGSLSRIFDPFYTTKFTGRGLGLAALVGIVNAHGGGLNVITALGEGARFIVYLPMTASVKPDVTESSARSGMEAPLAATSKVLVVDDEPDVSHLTERMLRRLGYEVLTAPDGATALTMLESGDHTDVELILMDVTMPNTDGPATARLLRARGLAARIILMSGYAEEELVGRGVLADADGFLQKPFTRLELSTAIESVTIHA